MKKLLLLFTICLLFSCQSEQNSVKQDYEDSLTPTSPLISLISRVCQNATACDNVLDGSSCFSVKLPVTITINDQVLNVVSISDFATISDIKNQFTTDDDIVHFTFPITIKYANSQETIIDSQSQLTYITDNCEPAGFHEITCVRFNFPFIINTYNTNSQAANSIEIASNPQLYDFLFNLSTGDLLSIVYPISVTDFDGLTIRINNNTELENVIAAGIEQCEIYSTGSENLADVLTNGSWYVSYFFDYWDETYNYYGYNFTFLPNGTFTAIKDAIIVNGEWELQIVDGRQRLEFDFDGSVFEELECDWKVMEFTGNEIHLSNEDGNGGSGNTDPGNRDGNVGNYYLYLTKN